MTMAMSKSRTMICSGSIIWRAKPFPGFISCQSGGTSTADCRHQPQHPGRPPILPVYPLSGGDASPSTGERKRSAQARSLANRLAKIGAELDRFTATEKCAQVGRSTSLFRLPKGSRL
jgi:hypothetical protein